MTTSPFFFMDFPHLPQIRNPCQTYYALYRYKQSISDPVRLNFVNSGCQPDFARATIRFTKSERCPWYKIIQSIPGIGEKIGATIISEMGEIDRFNHPKKLVAFAGVDPSVHSSVSLRQPSFFSVDGRGAGSRRASSLN